MKRINFGGVAISNTYVDRHFLLVGITGSGKTNLLQMMMRPALLNVQTEPDYRAVIYDQKQDMVSFIKAQGITDRELRVLNPYDSRCYEWDIARDVTGQDTAFQIASIFVPEEDSQNRYFSDATRVLLAGVMNVFIEKGIERQDTRGDKSEAEKKPDWRLADVIYAMRSQERLEHVLNQTEEGKELIALYLRNEKTTGAILSTADTRLTPLIVPATLWRKAGDKGRKLSLEEFYRGRYVLVLGNNQQARQPLQALNRIIFQRLTELLLDLPEVPKNATNPRRVWFFIDEARKIGKLDGLDDLMNNGRSKGAAVVLAFQDIDGMRSVYGKEVAQEITAMCGHFCFLKMSGTETPLWASQVIGEEEKKIKMENQGESIGGDIRQTTGTSGQMYKSNIVLPSQLTNLDYASPETGIEFYARAPSEGKGIINSTGKDRLPPQDVEKGKGLTQPNPEENLKRWPKIHDYNFKKLPVWEAEDFLRLGILPLPKKNSPKEEGSTQSEAEISVSSTEPVSGLNPTRKKQNLRSPTPIEEIKEPNGR